MRRFYITTPIYYASGDPHIGHAFATLTADVLARYHRQLEEDVYFLTGTDEHGSKIAEQAAAANQEPQQFVDDIAARYQKLWQALNIIPDQFIRTSSEQHRAGATAFVRQLRVNDALYEQDYEGLYCVGCEKFLTERELDEQGRCPDHQRAPITVKERNWFFKLSQYLPQVRAAIEKGEIEVEPKTRRNEILRMIADGIPDFSLSRDRKKVAWGIPFPDDESQSMYVWADALSNYITALDYPSGALMKKFWPADVQIVGAEINKFHSIYWPAMLLAAKLPPPRRIFVHGLFTVNGQKMSKSLGNVINPLNVVERFGVDATRYLLLSQFSAAQHGDIQESRFVDKYNDDLAKGIGNLVARLAALRPRQSAAGQPNVKLVADLEELAARYHDEMGQLNLFGALATARAAVSHLDRYIDETKPWQLTGNRQAVTLAALVDGVRQVIALFNPFMPDKMTEATALLDAAAHNSNAKPAPLFPRL